MVTAKKLTAASSKELEIIDIQVMGVKSIYPGINYGACNSH